MLKINDVTLPQVFLKHFTSKNKLPGLSVSGTLIENGLKRRRNNSEKQPCSGN